MACDQKSNSGIVPFLILCHDINLLCLTNFLYSTKRFLTLYDIKKIAPFLACVYATWNSFSSDIYNWNRIFSFAIERRKLHPVYVQLIKKIIFRLYKNKIKTILLFYCSTYNTPLSALWKVYDSWYLRLYDLKTWYFSLS